MQFTKITSRENDRVKAAAKLAKNAKARREAGLFTCEGKKLCLEAAAENVPLCSLFFTNEAMEREPEALNTLLSAAEEAFQVSPAVMEKLSATKSPQGIFAVCRPSEKMQRANDLSYVKNHGGRGLYLCLEKIADPGNMGTMIRTAAALGMDAILVTKDSADIYSEKVVRSAMGSVFKIPIILVDDMPQVIVYLKELGVSVFAAALTDSSTTPDAMAGPGKKAAVIGNEANGLSEQCIALADRTVKIPMQSGVESLNAAVAATICMWEMQK